MNITEELIAHVAGEPYERQQKFARARQVYDGEMDAPLVDPDTGEPNDIDNVILPLCGEIVDDGVDFLFGAGVACDVSEAYGEDAEKQVKAFWRANKFDTRLVELGLNGGITGQPFFKFEPDPDNPKDGASHRITVIDPAYVDVLWNPHNTSEVHLYRIEYPSFDAATGKPFVWRQDISANFGPEDKYGRKKIVNWTITNYKTDAPLERTRQKWYAMGVLSRQGAKWEKVGVYEWEFSWAPIFTCQNLIATNSFWGNSDIESAIIRLNNAANRVASNTAKTVRHFGHPTTIVAGGSLPEDGAIGEPIEFPEDDVNVYNLEMKSDLKASLDYLKMCIQFVFEAANVPEISKGKIEGNGQISGVALRVLYGPLLAVTKKKQLTYGDMLERFLECLLEYMGFTAQNDAGVHLTWNDPLPVNEKEQAETAEIDMGIGFSQATLIERRGGDPMVEADRKLEEGSNDPGMRGMLDLIGTDQPPVDAPIEESL